MSAHAIDVANDTFEREGIETSKSIPVVVDFCTPWCGAYRFLKSILEKLVSDYGGLEALP